MSTYADYDPNNEARIVELLTKHRTTHGPHAEGDGEGKCLACGTESLTNICQTCEAKGWRWQCVNGENVPVRVQFADEPIHYQRAAQSVGDRMETIRRAGFRDGLLAGFLLASLLCYIITRFAP